MKIKYPNHIWIEPTTRCNTKCITCGHNFAEFGQDMLPEVFERIEKQVLDHVDKVDLIGYGEPLMAKSFPDILNSCVKRGIKVSTTTNGLLLTEDLIEKLVVSNVDLVLSIDGVTPEVFNSIRPKIKFDRIIKALETIKKYKQKHDKSNFNLFINMVVMKRNMHQAEDMVKLANKYGASRIIYFNCYSDKSSQDELASEIPAKHPELLKRNFSSVRPLAKKYGIEVFAPDFFFSPDSINDNNSKNVSLVQTESIDKLFPHYCYMPWNCAYFNVEGHVFSCCIMSHSLGNVLKNSFDEIWTGSKYNIFRRLIHSNNPPRQCKNCNLPNGITFGNQKFLDIFLSENFIGEINCSAKEVQFQTKTIRVQYRKDVSKYFWCDKNITLKVKPVLGGKLLCVHISNLKAFEKYNSGTIIVNGSDPVEFDNTDEHILIKLPDHNDSSELLITINMNESWYFEEVSSEIAIGICKFSFYGYDLSSEMKKTASPNISEEFLSAMEKKLVDQKRKYPDKNRLVIFGASAGGRKLSSIAMQSGYEFVGFVDNYIHYSKKVMFSHPVFSPEKIYDLKPDIIAISSQSHGKDIAEEINPLCSQNNIRVISY